MVFIYQLVYSPNVLSNEKNIENIIDYLLTYVVEPVDT